jgi:hypothetical protein
MSQTDIYNQRELTPKKGNQPSSRKTRRRRRTSDQPVFDDKNRKRRSKNAGLRRFIHLSRKSENEKVFWWSMLTGVVVLLLAVAVWQFWYVERIAKEQSKESELHIPISHLESSNLSTEESP